jgi:hypothetical protein
MDRLEEIETVVVEMEAGAVNTEENVSGAFTGMDVTSSSADAAGDAADAAADAAANTLSARKRKYPLGHVVDLTGDDDAADSVFWTHGTQDCGVCWEKYALPARSAVTNPCGHVMCWVCTMRIMTSKESYCPFCKRDLYTYVN